MIFWEGEEANGILGRKKARGSLPLSGRRCTIRSASDSNTVCGEEVVDHRETGAEEEVLPEAILEASERSGLEISSPIKKYSFV